jgi:adenylate kinase family enzyme
VAGTSGAGKSTLARRIAAASGLPYQEIDALFHGPAWEPRPTFAAEVDDFTRRPKWVTEWQYGAVQPMLAARADVLVWLDYSRLRVMSRVIRRTVRRRVRREALWNGNLEAPLRTFFTDRDHVVRWAWRTHGERRALVEAAARDNPGLQVVRFRRPIHADRWVDETFR